MNLNHSTKTIVSALVVIAVLIVAYFAWDAYRLNKKYNFKQAPTTTTQALPADPQAEVQAGVEVSSSAEGTIAMSVPEGLPPGIPVEGKIVESFRAAYTKQGVVQYSVSYNSTKSKDVLWKTYVDFFNNNKYVVDISATNKINGTISGTKNRDTLSVVLSNPERARTYVQLNYLDRN